MIYPPNFLYNYDNILFKFKSLLPDNLSQKSFASRRSRDTREPMVFGVNVVELLEARPNTKLDRKCYLTAKAD